jgi:hypothetical protein
MQQTLAGSSTVALVRHQVSSDLAGETVILNLDTGIYYGLVDEVGARIWSLMQAPRTVAEIRDAILEEYEVAPERCEHDLLALLERLAAEGLVEILE